MIVTSPITTNHHQSPTNHLENMWPITFQSPQRFTAGISPAGIIPAGMIPAGLFPAGMFPAGMNPAGMIPARIIPAEIIPAPAGMIPAGMIPAGMIPVAMIPVAMIPAAMIPAAMPRLSRQIRTKIYICQIFGSNLPPTESVGSKWFRRSAAYRHLPFIPAGMIPPIGLVK